MSTNKERMDKVQQVKTHLKELHDSIVNKGKHDDFKQFYDTVVDLESAGDKLSKKDKKRLSDYIKTASKEVNEAVGLQKAVDTVNQTISEAYYELPQTDRRNASASNFFDRDDGIPRVKIGSVSMTSGPEPIIAEAKEVQAKIESTWMGAASTAVKHFLEVVRQAITEFIASVREFFAKSVHKHKFSSTIEAIKPGNQSALTQPAERPRPGTFKKYKAVMDEITQAGKNEEGTSSTLKGTGKK